MRRATRSTSPARCPASRSTSAIIDTRGFAGAAGNVVINGARPSSKSETPRNHASPESRPSRVARVEVGPGRPLRRRIFDAKARCSTSSCRRKAGSTAMSPASVRRLYTGRIIPDVSASALIRRGASTINLSAGTSNVLNHRGRHRHADRPRRPANSSSIRRKHNSYRDFNPYISGSWALEQAERQGHPH